MEQKRKQVYSGIGGQAIMEGIMMRNKERYAAAVRKPDGEIEVMEDNWETFSDKHPFAGWIFIRGIFALIDSLRLGIKTLMWSASFEVEEEPDASKGKKEKKKEEKPLSDSYVFVTVFISLIIAIGLFSVLPAFIAGLVAKVLPGRFLSALLEGIIRVGLFVGYVVLISCMKDIKRVYMYHGSEHKCINCVEHGLPLTVDNVMASSKEHKRCGTSFLLTVMLISVVIFMFIHVDTIWLRIVSRILLIPVIAGISYEVLRFTGNHDNAFTYILSRPGMWLQGLTTREPERDMCEVAIQAVERVFDWQQFLKDNFNDDISGTED